MVGVEVKAPLPFPGANIVACCRFELVGKVVMGVSLVQGALLVGKHRDERGPFFMSEGATG
ncbi:Uncharacterised protein [Mycobacteroides abscessus]|nr:Uncharacterised protein [Mycobacteroides abscessus]